MKLPKMIKVKQEYNLESIKDVSATTRKAIHDAGVLNAISAGQQVAIGIGSRGISQQIEVVTSLCRAIESRGAVPFIFPAMGSHGGATSEGQEKVLKSLGFAKETTGVEIRSDATGQLIGYTGDNIPLYVDKHALKADHVVLVNRVKPHTKFKGDIESGIAKMMTVGLGKVQGAGVMHRNAVTFGFPHVIKTAALKIAPLIGFSFGVAMVETPFKTLHSLSIVTPDSFLETERQLLKLSTSTMATIPLDEIDLLIVDEIGKDVSGTGMDTNVIGRNRDILGSFTTKPRVHRIFVRDLTDRTEGNANGIGFADFTTRRCVDKIDMKKTYKNALTAMSPEKAAIPVYLENDKEAIIEALASIGLTDGTDAKIVRIKNTSQITEFTISQSLGNALTSPTATVISQPQELIFDENDNLVSGHQGDF